MLDSKVLELTDGLIQTQFAERRQRLQEEFVRAAQEFNASNRYSTSVHVQHVAEICRREVEIRARIVHNAHLRVLSQRHEEREAILEIPRQFGVWGHGELG